MKDISGRRNKLQLKFNRIRLSEEVSKRLPLIKARTGMTPNIFCRVGLCLSMAEPMMPNPDQYKEDGFEFNRYTLLGEYDSLMIAIFKQWCVKNGIDLKKDLHPFFRAHLNRGVELLFQRVKSLSMLPALVTNKLLT